MIDETVNRIEATVQNSDVLSDERKNELLTLISDLKTEINTLNERDAEHAGSIIRYAESSVKEAIRSEQDTELLEYTLKGLTLSVRKFEASHPTLLGVINNIGQILGNIGI